MERLVQVPSTTTTDRAFFEASPDALFVVDAQGRYVDWNPAALAMVGVDAETLRSMNVGDLHPAEERAAALQDFRQLATVGHLERDYRLLRTGRERFWVRLRAVKLADDRFIAICQDIDARVMGAEAERRHGHYLRTILDTALDGFWVLDMAGNLVDVNPAYCAMSGYTREELLRMRISDLEAEEVPEVTAARIKRIAQRGFDRFESSHRRKDGSIVGVSVAVRLVEQAMMVCFFQDITERKRAEAEAREREAELRAYFETPAVGISVTGPEKQWLRVNEALSEMLGYSREELEGMTWFQLTHPDDLPATEAAFDRLLAGEIDRYSLDKRYLRKDGSVLWALLSVSCTRKPDGDIDHVVSILQDIGERKRAEDALRRSEAHFRQLVSALPIPLAFNDSRGRVVTINPKFTEVLGYAHDDVPTVDAWFRKAYPDDAYRAWVAKTWSDGTRGVAAGEEIEPREYRVSCKDGTFRTMSVGGTPVGEDFLVTLLDVTESRALQAKLALASRLASLGTLVAGVAHEVNNPLAGLMSNTGTALEDVQALEEALARGVEVEPARLHRGVSEVREMLSDVKASAERIARIVRDLSVIGRPDKQRRAIRLADTARRSLQWLPDSVAARARIQIEAGDVPDVLASEGQVEQVIVNLVSNACLAIPPGREGEVTLRLRPSSTGHARLEVSDNGKGIEPENLERIFDPFFTTRPPGQGTGLGLSICSAIVSAHGGTITVKSQVDRGSTFRVELPAAPANA